MRKKILFFIVVFNSLIAAAQTDSAAHDSIGASLDIGNNSEYDGYGMLDQLLQEHTLFLVGENYNYVAFNSKMEFKLLRYMNHKVGLRNYLLEASAAKADLINQYISEGDSTVEKLLQSVSTVKYMRLYKNLKKLNKKLPDSLRIRVHGIDVERTSALPLVKMSQCFSDDSVPDDLRIVVEAINGAAKYIISRGLEEYERERDGRAQESDNYFYNPSAFSVRMSVEEFRKTYDSLRPRFQQWLGVRFAEFDHAVSWLDEYKTWIKYRKTAFEFTWREELMYLRLNELLAGYPNEKFFGQFGMCRSTSLRVPEGCGAYSFSGLVHKLKNNPGSRGKNVVNIGMYYSDEFERSEDERNKQHQQYEADLEYLFDKTDDNTASIVNLDMLYNANELKKEFRLVILNDNFRLYDDDEEYDPLYSDTTSTRDYDYDDYRNARMYLGWVTFRNYVNIDKLDAELESAGMEQVGALQYAGAELGFALEDKTFFRIYGGSATASSRNYKGSVFMLEGGEAVVYKKLLKMGIFSSLGYIQHTITEYSPSTKQTYFVNYESPRVYKNPGFVIGLSADVYLDLSPVYIFLGAGRQWDLGRSAWKLDGQSTGSRGGISNTSWITNVGFGFSVPLHWISSI